MQCILTTCKKCFILLLQLLCAELVFVRAREPPKINLTEQGIIFGREVSKSRIQKIIGYYGIPYAQPPVGDRRFAPPVTDPLPHWNGERNATEYAAACLQTSKDFKEEDLPFLQLISDLNFATQEDCLYLNVFVPNGSPTLLEGFATIIWFHPGNFTIGSPSMWNPHTLVYRQRVILVTVAWRLNIMGFFTTMDGEAPGNYGLMDQQAAMMWVKKNIKLFRGNPDNISIMGYGTGGVSVGMHMINLNSRGYFNKAIAMSANFLNPSAVKYPEEDKNLLNRLAESFGCIRNPTSQLIACLRRVEGGTLVNETSNINWRPMVDIGLTNNSNSFLSELPKSYFERGDFHQVPFLTGYTNMEEILTLKSLETGYTSENVSSEILQQILIDIVTNNDIPSSNGTDSSCSYNYNHIIDAVLFFYKPATDIQDLDTFRRLIADFTTERNIAASTYLHASYMSREQPTFVYRFDMKPITQWAVENIPEWVAVPHLFDLIYIWGIPYWSDTNTWELRDKRFADIIMSFWTNFAKSGDPTEGTLYPIRWGRFVKDKPGILIIDSAFNMSNGKNLNYKAFEFWNDYYPKVFEISTQCCNATDGGTMTLSSTSTLLQCLVQTASIMFLLQHFP